MSCAALLKASLSMSKSKLEGGGTAVFGEMVFYTWNHLKEVPFSLLSLRAFVLRVSQAPLESPALAQIPGRILLGS